MNQGLRRQMRQKVNIPNRERTPTVHGRKRQPHMKMHTENEQAVHRRRSMNFQWTQENMLIITSDHQSILYTLIRPHFASKVSKKLKWLIIFNISQDVVRSR